MAIGLPNFERLVTGFLGLNSYGIGPLRTVEWGRRYLWAMRFIDVKPPAPFTDYFPASEITVPLAIAQSFDFSAGQTSYAIPKNQTVLDLQVTFFDDANSTMLKFIRDWIELDIFNDGRFVTCLLDSHQVVRPRTVPIIATNVDKNVTQPKVNQGDLNGRVYPIRQLEFVLLTPDLEEVKGTRQYFTVYPEGQINFSGGSDSSANQFEVTFKIVNSVLKGESSTSSDFLSKAKKTATQLLGRFV